MHHYFPPKNFTDRCWGPDSEIGTVPCRGSCFILVEEIFEHFSTHAVMRGCVNRFLLFGLDEDVRDALMDKSECRTTDRRLLHLVALTPQTDLVNILEFDCDNVLMYWFTMQLCQHGPRPVDRCFLRIQLILSSPYADFSLHYALLDDILPTHVTYHSLNKPKEYGPLSLEPVSAAPTKPTAVLQENKSKAEKDNEKKREERAEKLEVKQDEEKKEGKKKESRRKDEKTSKKEKENKQAERKEKIEQLEGNKEELPVETQKKAKVLIQMAVNITQEEEEEVWE
uniref:Uncharacterized protein n=1 Tax=Wuchereria bancrofti TaxID=6293 RepID=A0AAF5PP69_WUCBA